MFISRKPRDKKWFGIEKKGTLADCWWLFKLTSIWVKKDDWEKKTQLLYNSPVQQWIKYIQRK